MTAAKIISRIVLGTAGLSVVCAIGLSSLCAASFAGAYLTELGPSLLRIGTVEEAEQYFDSICSTFPRSLEGAFPDGLPGSDVVSALVPAPAPAAGRSCERPEAR